jgi:plasmid stabilization system protein ParE
VTLEFHPAVQQDFNAAIAYYETASGLHLADRFEAEFRASLAAIKASPTRFPPYHQSPLFRRARLINFPYVVLFRTTPVAIRVTLLKHERRHPLHGLHRR